MPSTNLIRTWVNNIEAKCGTTKKRQKSKTIRSFEHTEEGRKAFKRNPFTRKLLVRSNFSKITFSIHMTNMVNSVTDFRYR